MGKEEGGTVKKSVWAILLAVFLIGAAGFLYTFVQPRYTAKIVGIGRARSVTTSAARRSYRTHSHTVVPLTVTYTDGSGTEQRAEITYARPDGPLSVGQEITIVHSFNGLVVYPFTGLRLFCGFLCAGLGLFLFFTWLDRERKQ